MFVLAADVGGTYTRLAYAQCEPSTQFKIITLINYCNHQFADFYRLLDDFLAKLGPARATIQAASLGVAGLVTDNHAKLTNLPWTISGHQLSQILQLSKVRLRNDFTMIGYALPNLTQNELVTLQTGLGSDTTTNLAYLGAGTGLGAGFVARQADKFRVFSTEAGHVDFAPTNQLQLELLKFLLNRYPHVSLERVLSGPGLTNLYHFIRKQGPRSNRSEHPILAHLAQQENNSDFAAQITELALQHHDPLAQQALDLFISIYGAVAGNWALTTLPLGGLYIVGNIAQRLLTQLQGPHFLDSYLQKGRLSQLLHQIPVQVVVTENLGLIGAIRHTQSIEA